MKLSWEGNRRRGQVHFCVPQGQGGGTSTAFGPVCEGTFPKMLCVLSRDKMKNHVSPVIFAE